VATTGCERSPLGKPRCRQGRCVGGRTRSYQQGLWCWFEPVQVVTFDRPHVLLAWRNPTDPEPDRALVIVDEPGRMTVRVDWGGCSGDRELQVDSVDPKELVRRRAGDREILEFPVVPDRYELRLRPASVGCLRAGLTVHLDRADGAPAVSRYHGLL